MSQEWRLEEKTTKGELEDLSEQYSDEYSTELPAVFKYGFGVGALLLTFAASPLLVGLGVIWGYFDLTVSYFESHIEEEFEQEMNKLEGKPDSTQVKVFRKYRYTGKDGGHWIPMAEFKVEVVA